MEPTEIKRLIESRLNYNEAKRLLAKLVQRRSPQTDMLEEEPQVLSLIGEVIQPELEQSRSGLIILLFLFLQPMSLAL